jgi:Fe-S cluster assembly protein SufD
MISIDNMFLIADADGVEEGTLPAAGRHIIVPAGRHIDISFLLLKGDADIRVTLSGKKASCRINAVYLSHENDKNNLKIEVFHEASETISHQVVKGIVTDTSKTDFHGIIHIPPQSQQCIGNQNHRAILLTSQATVTAIPELEIYADDVQCAHGSAIGALDAGSLFYLMSRGISEKVARHILLQAMISDILPPSFEPILQEWMTQNV